MLDQYQDGADLTVHNVFYQRPTKDSEGNRVKDYLAIVYSDNSTGKKHHEIIYEPNFTYYIMKEPDPGYNQLFIEKEKVEPVVCKYSQLLKSIAERTGNIDFYNSNLQSGNYSENQKLHTLPQVFASDVNIEDYYRKEFGNRFTNNIHRLSKSFFDIEVDTRYMAGDFTEMGECPINCVGYLNGKTHTINSYLLRNDKNKLIEEFENEYSFNIFSHSDIMNFIEENIGGYKQFTRYNMKEFTVNIRFFDSEIELLSTFFGDVHRDDNDFIMGWNSSGFDLEYIIARIKVLGYDPVDIMCDQSWTMRQVYNYVDNKNLSEFAERGDYTVISGNTVWIDQMIQFCSRRKAKIGSFTSFKLDDIGTMIAGVHKLDYSHITKDIAMLPWLDFKTFVLYNIFDVIVQYCIEFKCNDMEYIFAKALMNNTSYKKIHRQTVYLINRMNKEWDKLGYIIGNNVNKWNEKPDKFAGALVGDPLHLSDYSKLKIDGKPVNIADTGQDYDYKSLYPSIDLENNIAPNTQIGKIEIENKVYENENRYANEKYERGGEFVENLVCDNIIVFANRWLHLANVSEMVQDLQEFYMTQCTCDIGYNYLIDAYQYTNGQYISCPFVGVTNDKIIQPFVNVTGGAINPFRFYNKRPNN